MAVSTLTTTTFMNPPRSVHAGVNEVAGSFNSGASVFGTAGDTLFLAKLPHGAKIMSFEEDHSSGATTNVWSSGLTTGGPGGAASLSAFIASGVQATSNRAQAGSLPLFVSNSDLDPNRFGILSMTGNGGASATTSIIVNWRCTYTVGETG